METDKHIVIGFEDDVVCGANTARRQVEELTQWRCCVCRDSGGTTLDWPDLYGSTTCHETPCLQAIIEDRMDRVDREKSLSWRPPFCVATVSEDTVVRLEFYEGDTALSLQQDFRSVHLQDRELSPFMETDYFGSDPLEFIRDVLNARGDVATAFRSYWSRYDVVVSEEETLRAEAAADAIISGRSDTVRKARESWAEILHGVPHGPSTVDELTAMTELLQLSCAGKSTELSQPSDGPHGPDPEGWWREVWSEDAPLGSHPAEHACSMTLRRRVHLLTPDDLDMLPDRAEFHAKYANAPADEIPVRIHYFHALAGWDWYPLWAEWDATLGDILFYGYVFGFAGEFGTFTLEWLRHGFCETLGYTGTIVEREKWWRDRETTLADVVQRHTPEK